MDIGKKIRQIRKERGLTQAQLGEATGMFDSAIRRIEQNHNNQKISTLMKLASALGVSLTELFEEGAGE